MTALRPFEKQAVRFLAKDVVAPDLLEALEHLSETTRHEYTGSGYFLTLAHPQLQKAMKTLSCPVVIGWADGIQCGFVLFLGNHEMTLECHTWGELPAPSDFRERSVQVSVSDDLIFVGAQP